MLVRSLLLFGGAAVATPSANFTASGTQFSIPASTAEQYDGTLFLIRVLQALEDHDHGATRGKPAARLAAGAVTGSDLTLSGDLAVDGGDLTSTSATFNLLTTGVSTLNVG